ncbi:MAG TPA: NUMOD4 motif-containing HNH endonuclease [Patescibacteria group bacterium]|nr:NUMOD4 motif-containing HNH endonuclease [Patescibacteria group bacterium]
MDLKNEIWKDIPGCEGYYQASNLGRIRAVERMVKTKPKGKWYMRKLPFTIRAQGTNQTGYKMVGLCINGIESQHRVHRLVASAFIPNPENKSDINHKNGNKNDNSVENLEWMTRGENHRHAYLTGLKRRPKGKRILNEKKVLEIKLLLSRKNIKNSEISRLFSVSGTCISNIKSNKRWGYVAVN